MYDPEKVDDLIDAVLPSVVELRHELHAFPELAFEEHETAGRIRRQLESIGGLEIQTGIAETGVVAVLNGTKPGRCVALRAELDALPIQERSDLPYVSKTPGKMHACGHDGHMSCLVGAARVLTNLAADLPGKVKFIFQPAEERGGGAQVMCEAGVLDRPQVDGIFALHGWPYMPLGSVGIKSGPFMASSDTFEITIHGVGGHAAYPHASVDPVLVASHIVVALQSIVSRSVDPLASVVVTVAAVHAGTAHNVIPESANLIGTIRCLDRVVRESVWHRIRLIAKDTASAFGADAEVTITAGYPVVVNDLGAAAIVMESAREVVGANSLQANIPSSMGGEDFAYYGQRVPAAIWRLGVRRGDSGPMLHQPTYDFPDDALAVGIRMHCAVAMRFLADART